MSSTHHHKTPKVIRRMSQELWDMVANNLPAVSTKDAAQALGFHLRTEQKKQYQLWDLIFRDQTWISKATVQYGVNPVLVGWGLHKYCNTKNIQVAKPAYLILVGGDQSGDLRFEKEIFFKSLRSHIFRKESSEVVFNSGLVLNVANVCSDAEVIPVKLDKLFSYQYKRLRTAYYFTSS